MNNINSNNSRGILVDNSDNVEIRRNSIYCNGSTSAERSTPNFAIRLIGGANGGISTTGALSAPPVMTAATGIA